jgi:hypothetical protein
VWVVPFLFAAGVAAWRTRTRTALAAAVGGFVLFVVSPHWWWDADHGTTVAGFVVGNAYTWCALAVLAFAAFRSADRQFGRPRVHVDHRAVA